MIAAFGAGLLFFFFGMIPEMTGDLKTWIIGLALAAVILVPAIGLLPKHFAAFFAFHWSIKAFIGFFLLYGFCVTLGNASQITGVGTWLDFLLVRRFTPWGPAHFAGSFLGLGLLESCQFQAELARR